MARSNTDASPTTTKRAPAPSLCSSATPRGPRPSRDGSGRPDFEETQMKQLADDLYILDGFPPYAINVYLMGDTLVDAATRHAAGRILRQLRGQDVKTHALT